MAAAVRGALKPIAPGIAGVEFRPLQGLVDKSVSPRRFTVMLLGGFALFALILASLGIYGVISYSVNQRTQEIGIRMALGASAGRVQSGIVRHTLALAAIGMTIGTVASWGALAVVEGAAVRSDGGRPIDVCRDAGGADDGRGDCRVSARAPRIAHRSHGGAAGRLTRVRAILASMKIGALGGFGDIGGELVRAAGANCAGVADSA